MFPSKIVLFAILAVIPAACQTASMPSDLKSLKIVFIDNQAADETVLDSAHLILASSQFTWSHDREKADLVMRIKRHASEGSRTTTGDVISISIRDTYTLEVISKADKLLWKGDADLDPSIFRKDRTEQSWLDYLHRHPVAKLLNQFLSSAGGDQ